MVWMHTLVMYITDQLNEWRSIWEDIGITIIMPCGGIAFRKSSKLDKPGTLPSLKCEDRYIKMWFFAGIDALNLRLFVFFCSGAHHKALPWWHESLCCKKTVMLQNYKAHVTKGLSCHKRKAILWWHNAVIRWHNAVILWHNALIWWHNWCPRQPQYMLQKDGQVTEWQSICHRRMLMSQNASSRKTCHPLVT